MSEHAPEATASFTKEDAEAAGWTLVHEAIDAETEGVTLNSTVYRAEKYLTQPGRAGTFVEAFGHTEEALLAAIATREQQFAPGDDKTVMLPAEDAEEVDPSDDSTIERVSDAEYSDASNDTLTVLSDPSDPDSDPKQVVKQGGVEVPEEALSEPTAPSTSTEAETREADQAAIDAAIKARDEAEGPEAADSPEAAAAVAQARHDAFTGDEGDSGNDPEKVQPEAGEATDASDSEQQSQVPDAEAASSDAVSTNTDDAFPKDNVSQPEVLGPDSDAEAPAGAPNAQPNESNTSGVEVVPADAAPSETPESPSTPSADDDK